MVTIAPSILSSDFARLGEEVRAVEAAGGDCIHVDVMDGTFVPNLTIGPPVVAALRKVTKLPLDVHLMMVTPEKHLRAFQEAGADILTVHAEACVHLHRTLSEIRSLGMKAGVALNPSTSDQVLEYVLGLVDQVLVMTVNPGFGGQSFLPEVLPKVTRLRESAKQFGFALEVDGGIQPDTARLAAQAGASAFVAGHAIFRANDYRAAIAALRTAAEGA